MKNNLFFSLERRVLFFAAAFQFIIAADFMIVMPLGPFFTRTIGISSAHIGFIAGVYTLSSAITSILCAKFLDRFSRKKVMFWSMLGLGVGMFCAILAQSFDGLLAARVFAGIFGGPASSISMAVVIDVTPEARRGRAMSIVMSGFSVATILGVPIGLTLANHWGWKGPFCGMSFMSFIVALAVLFGLPEIKSLAESQKMASAAPSFFALIFREKSMVAHLITFFCIFSGFLMVPSIASYLVFNLHYPANQLSLLYMACGLVGLFAMRWAGRLCDYYSPACVVTVISIVMMMSIYMSFVAVFISSAVLIGVLFMTTNSMRRVVMSALVSRVPRAHERAGFMSIQTAVRSFASAISTMLSSMILVSDPVTHALLHMDWLAYFSIGLSIFVPALMFLLEHQLRKKDTGHWGVSSASIG